MEETGSQIINEPQNTSPESQHAPNEPRQAFSEPQRTSKLAVASLIMGILSIPLFFLKLGIVAIIMGVISLFKLKNPALKGKVLAICGIILGVFGMLLSMNFWTVSTDLMFNPNRLAPQKTEATQKVVDQNVLLIEQYKTQYGAYPESLAYVKGVITGGFYNMHYELSADKQSYILRSGGPDGLCGTDDDILPSGSTQPKRIDCLVNLGGDTTVQTSVLLGNDNDFTKTSLYHSFSDWDPASSYRPNFTIEYPSFWKKRSIELPISGANASKAVTFNKFDEKHPECTSCFGGAEIKVTVYFKNPTPPYPRTVESLLELYGAGSNEIKSFTFLGYNAKSIEGTKTANEQYMNQKITFKAVVFETPDEIFVLYYRYDATHPIGTDMDKLINSFKIIR